MGSILDALSLWCVKKFVIKLLSTRYQKAYLVTLMITLRGDIFEIFLRGEADLSKSNPKWSLQIGPIVQESTCTMLHTLGTVVVQ